MKLSGSDPWPKSHHDMLQYYYEQYEKNISSGEYDPALYPWISLGSLVVIIYLLIPHRHRPWLRNARFFVFAWAAAFAAYCIRYMRARGMAATIGIGLISAWAIVWVTAILVANDAQTDFQRIERTEGVFGFTTKENNRVNGDCIGKEPEQHGLTKAATSNGHVRASDHLGPSKRHGEFAWQPFPEAPFIERLDWVCDVFLNFRGTGWNWRTSAIPPLPKWVQQQLQQNSTNPPRHSTRVYATQVKVYTTRRELLIANAKTLLMGYLILDILKTITHHDPYFWGQIDRSPPPYYPSFLISSPILTRMYRLIVLQFAIKWALQTIYSLGPLFFSGVLGPSILGARAEPWIYPETWGSYTHVLDRGLAGWWSGWWHQTFRFAFEQPGRRITEMLGLDAKTPSAKLLQLLIAFALSGFLHASGSYTTPGPTSPFKGPMLFFLLQAPAIFIEALLRRQLRSMGLQHQLPPWIMRIFTFIYLHVFFYYTAPLLCDDFARGGVLLFEPLPISVVRGLGFGVEGDGWWCWGGTHLLWWHRDDRWWRSGIAF